LDDLIDISKARLTEMEDSTVNDPDEEEELDASPLDD
jgi:hypothetical protein